LADVFGLRLQAQQAERLLRHAEMVLAANTRVRLTAITSWEEILIKHILDCLFPLVLDDRLSAGLTVADLGSGGGYPGLALAIAAPGSSFVLIEATNKKAVFIRETADAIGLANVTVWPRRAEEAGWNAGRGFFDIVTARAVADLPVLTELAHPLLRTGGILMAWKGPEAAVEIEGAGRAFARLGAEIAAVHAYELPQQMGRRSLVIVRKTQATPDGFPRRPGMAEKKPL